MIVCLVLKGPEHNLSHVGYSWNIFSEGDLDPDWEYALQGACFGSKVIDESCSTYNKSNYDLITKGKVEAIILGRLQLEIDEEMVSTVDEPCVCTHAMGGVPKGHDDYDYDYHY